MSLTDTAIRAAKAADKPYKLADAKGLYLCVQPNGSKLWRLAYRFADEQKTLALGVYGKGDVSLDATRDKMRKAKVLLKAGADPAQQRRLDKIAAATATAGTFDAIADEFPEKLEREPKHAALSLDKRSG